MGLTSSKSKCKKFAAHVPVGLQDAGRGPEGHLLPAQRGGCGCHCRRRPQGQGEGRPGVAPVLHLRSYIPAAAVFALTSQQGARLSVGISTFSSIFQGQGHETRSCWLLRPVQAVALPRARRLGMVLRMT